jgi:hypothetical protein
VLNGRWRDLPLRELGEDEVNVMRPPLTYLTALAMIVLSLVGCRSTVTPLDERVSYCAFGRLPVKIWSDSLKRSSSGIGRVAFGDALTLAVDYTRLHRLSLGDSHVVVPSERSTPLSAIDG